jgi:hypothetical protein
VATARTPPIDSVLPLFFDADRDNPWLTGLGDWQMAPPYMNASGLVMKILDKVIEAAQPERFTQDFLATKLGYGSGSARPFIPLLKRIGFLGTDGIPTKLYAQFRNPDTRGAAMADALKMGYRELYERNEYVHDLPKDRLKNLVVELTGLPAGDSTVNGVVNTFTNLKAYANFESKLPEEKPPEKLDQLPERRVDERRELDRDGTRSAGLNLSYHVYLNLPETSDVEVFNAIFRSLKENILKA